MSTTRRAQRIWLTLAICIFCSLSTTSALTYYIADSCDNYPIMPYIMTNATSTIKNTGRRNNFKNLDPAFQTAFKTIFKTEQSSQQDFTTWAYFHLTAFSIVQQSTSLLGALQRTYVQDTSDVRIVCDNDTYGNPNDRWQPVPDIKLPTNIQGPAPKPNSQRTFGVDKEFFDQVNFMRRTTASIGCQKPGVAASTYFYSMAPFDFNGRTAPEGLPARRTVISMCPRILDKSITPYQTWDDLPYPFQYSQAFPDGDTTIWDSMPMLVMCHELRHLSQIRFLDVAGAASYLWGNIMRFDDLNSLINADNHKYLDILAHAENAKWRLNSANPQNGQLVYDTSIIG